MPAKCFVMMPFDKQFADVYAAIRTVLEAVVDPKITCFRLDDAKVATRISEDLIRELNECTICVADLTGKNVNVMWEVGYAMALCKPLVTISQDTQLPFDLYDLRTLIYDRHALHSTLHSQLKEAVSETLHKHRILEVLEDDALGPPAPPRVIAVTGSREADRGKCKLRIRSILTPYLNRKTSWLCGANGVADECCLEYLSATGQEVRAVGYFAEDLSDYSQKLIKQRRIVTVDVAKEALPRNLGIQNYRDLFFLTKADLLILFWNGRSSGTRTLVDFLHKHERDHILAFV